MFGEQGVFEREVDLGAVAPVSARASSNTQTASGFTQILPSLPGSLVLFGEAALGPGSEPVITRHEMPAYRVATNGETLANLGSSIDYLSGVPGARSYSRKMPRRPRSLSLLPN